MKVFSKVKKLGSYSLVLLALHSYNLLAEDFKLDNPSEGGLFQADSKVIKTLFTIESFIKVGAGLFACTCFISSANAARSGNYGRSGGAFLGGVISALAAYLVGITQA